MRLTLSFIVIQAAIIARITPIVIGDHRIHIGHFHDTAFIGTAGRRDVKLGVFFSGVGRNFVWRFLCSFVRLGGGG